MKTSKMPIMKCGHKATDHFLSGKPFCQPCYYVSNYGFNYNSGATEIDEKATKEYKDIQEQYKDEARGAD